MCGACGRDRPDWLSAFLSTSYVREVVAARLGRLGPATTVTVQPAGWSWTGRGRPRFCATIDQLVGELVGEAGAPSDAAGVVGWVDGLPRHRPHLVARESVPRRHRGTAPTLTATAADELPDSDPRTSINRLLGLLLIRRLHPARPMITRLTDDQGLWTFASVPTSS